MGSAAATVLVVDDEVLIRMDLVARLEGAGYLTLEAGNATEAIALLESHPEIRVVFTDIRMPGTMDGLELARCVRKRWPPTIIVVCSGNEQPGADEMPIRASFLAKPFTSASLKPVLR